MSSIQVQPRILGGGGLITCLTPSPVAPAGRLLSSRMEDHTMVTRYESRVGLHSQAVTRYPRTFLTRTARNALRELASMIRVGA